MPDTIGQIAVDVRDVAVDYRVPGRRKRGGLQLGGGHGSFRAVEGVTFSAHTGETVGVIGRNGSGKSSLLRAVAGLMPTAHGSIRASAIPVLLGVGAALKGDLTGRQNIVLGGTALGVRRRVMLDRMAEVIEFSGLEKSIDRPFKTYSSGMKARLQFAVSTAVQPTILLVDEALAVGDEEFRERSNDRIQELVGGAATVFLVSHSLTTIVERCDRALWLDAGRQVMWAGADEVVAAYRADVKERRAD